MDGIVLLVGFFNICFKGVELKMWLGLAVFEDFGFWLFLVRCSKLLLLAYLDLEWRYGIDFYGVWGVFDSSLTFSHTCLFFGSVSFSRVGCC